MAPRWLELGWERPCRLTRMLLASERGEVVRATSVQRLIEESPWRADQLVTTEDTSHGHELVRGDEELPRPRGTTGGVAN